MVIENSNTDERMIAISNKKYLHLELSLRNIFKYKDSVYGKNTV